MIWESTFPKKSIGTGIDPALLLCGFVASLAITGRFKKEEGVIQTGEDASGAWTGTKLKIKWDYGKLPKMPDYEDKQVNGNLPAMACFMKKH